MKVARLIAVIAIASSAVGPVSASGPLGLYGIVEKVVVEPNEQAPERVQVWGAFIHVENGPGGVASEARRGYLYFKLPYGVRVSAAGVDRVRREWADLKSVAGTGQAVGFGDWGWRRVPRADEKTDLSVRPGSITPAEPAEYSAGSGLVKLTDGGSHAAIIKQLRNALTRRQS